MPEPYLNSLSLYALYSVPNLVIQGDSHEVCLSGSSRTAAVLGINSKQGARLQYESVGLFAPPRVQVEEVEVNITDQGN